MKRYALAALCAAFVASGCGGAGTSGPQETAQAWVDAIAAHDWQAACALESTEYQGIDCAATYATNVDGMSALSGYDVSADMTLDATSCGMDEGSGEFSCVASSEFTGPLLVVVAEVDGEWRVVRVG